MNHDDLTFDTRTHNVGHLNKDSQQIRLVELRLFRDVKCENGRI